PLVPEDTLTIIDAIFTHIERVPASLAYTINERVEGNPLFVREYLSMLFDTDVFQRTSEGKWRFNIIMLDEALTSLPPGLQAILQARLDDLPRQGRQLIQAAAISGQRFWASAVKSMLEVDDLDAMLKPLLMRGMIIKDEDSTFDDEDAYRFRHRIYRDVAYDMIPRAKREAYHDTMAMWLLERVARKTRYYPVLAEQFLHSGAYLAAMHTYLEASEVLVEQGENRAALSLIEQSLGIANKIPREEALPVVARLWAGRSQALMRLERYDEASAASQSALMLLEELSDDQLITTRIVAERMQGLAHLSLERYNDAYDAFTRAHNLLSLNATEEIAGVLLALAKLYYYQGRLDESYAYQKRAFDKAEQLQDIHLIGSSLSGLGKLAAERGQFQVALQSFDDSLQIHRTLAVLIPQATDLFRIGIVHLLTFNYGKAYEYFRDADRFFGSVGKANMLIQGYCGYALIMLGRTTQGKALIQDAIEHAPHDVNMQRTLQFVHLASLYALEDYVTVRERGLAFIQRPQISPVIKARAQRYLGLASHRLDTRDARHHLESALEAESYYGGRNLWRCYAALGECTSDIDEQDDYYKKAADLIIEMASSLRDYPDMREGFLRSAPVQDVFEHAGTVNPLTLP
ncbi:MAG: tetratricopeptide repeat protein, partial [Chloroflexota bacterium]